jgi:fumarate reductase (CoM/CoB) subunit B
MSGPYDKYRREIEYCTYCPKLCRFACPVAQVECSETVTPTGKMTVLRQVRDGVIPLDQDAASLMYNCSGCLRSRTYCEHEIEVIRAFEAARHEAVKAGVAPDRVYKYLETWQRYGNPFGEDLLKKLKALAPEEYFTRPAPVLIFTGCTILHYHPEVLKSMIQVLSALKVEFRIFSNERLCCGFPIFTLGHREASLEQMKNIASAISSAEIVISPCPTCASNLRQFYPEQGIEIKPRVLHISEFLAERVSELSLERKNTRKVIYHDPCHLGRYLGVYDQPRQILAAILEQPLIEFYENREHATCCGGGGGLPVTHPLTAREIARGKIQDFLESGADLLCTACPMCQRALERSGRDKGIVVKDISQLIADCLPGG